MDELLQRLQELAINDDGLLKKYAQQPGCFTEERNQELLARFQASSQLIRDVGAVMNAHKTELDLVGALLVEIGIIRYHSGRFFQLLEDQENALCCFQDALAKMKLAGPKFPLLATCYTKIADIFSIQAKYQESMAMYEHALESMDDSKTEPLEKGIVLNNLAIVVLQLEQPEKALSCFRRAIEAVSVVTERSEEARIRNNYGIALSDVDQFEDALVQHREALIIALNFNNSEQAHIAQVQIKLCKHYVDSQQMLEKSKMQSRMNK